MDGIFEMGFTKPSKIQGLALPIAMKGRNIIGQAGAVSFHDVM